VTTTLTDNGVAGAGLAVTVNTALPPSITPDPAVTLTSGFGGGGGVNGLARHASKRSNSAYTFCHNTFPSPAHTPIHKWWGG